MKYPVLLIDTSSRHLVFARIDGQGEGRVLVELPDGRSEDAIDNAVAKLFLRIEDIAEIWLGEGPGFGPWLVLGDGTHRRYHLYLAHIGALARRSTRIVDRQETGRSGKHGRSGRA